MSGVFALFDGLFRHTSPKPSPAQWPFDPMAYLAEHGVGETWTGRRVDFGGYQIDDTFRVDDTHAITAWSYAPFGQFTVGGGDGGERYTIQGDTVFIDSTEDGGQPGVIQQFGSGWVVCRSDADTTWRMVSSMIGFSPVFTRYSRQIVTLPVLGNLDCIVSEHYGASDVASASAMERSFYAKGFGRVCWQSWNRAGIPVDPARAPDFGWNRLDGFVLTDTRVCVNPITTAPVSAGELWHP